MPRPIPLDFVLGRRDGDIAQQLLCPCNRIWAKGYILAQRLAERPPQLGWRNRILKSRNGWYKKGREIVGNCFLHFQYGKWEVQKKTSKILLQTYMS